MFNVVLVEPEIPQNTGNISRTCAVTGCALHLVRPLGFSVDDKHLKRAGLDYWSSLKLFYHDSFDELVSNNPNGRFFLFTTHAEKSYADVNYIEGDFLVFGKETTGLGQTIIESHKEFALRIPMLFGMRSLNLSNAAALVVYEAFRQNDFKTLI